jgi:methylenetetrahydrofolate dehydrogenase (NADP+)/methenyltetrahydrofolate cyclohydrolase
MKLLYGKTVADKILSHLKNEIFAAPQKPGLAVILVGNDQASKIYVNLKEKKAQEIGMNFFRFDLSQTTLEDEILKRIEALNHDKMVHGIIVQLPLPQGFNTEKIITSIDPKKDADGFHPQNAELFLKGKGSIWPVFPRAIAKLIQSAEQELTGKKALVIANSEDFGKIMCAALENLASEATYILAGSISSQLEKICDADIVVSAVGRPGLLKGEMFKEGAIVIDGGIEKVGEKVLGDVDFASTEGKNGFLTPVPGGVGPLTIACLLENTFLAFEAQQKEK